MYIRMQDSVVPPVVSLLPDRGRLSASNELGQRRRTIADIRESKLTEQLMVYASVPDYTCAQWVDCAGVDVAVLGDSSPWSRTVTRTRSRRRWT